MLLQLAYASRPFGFDTTSLAGILLSARRKNPALGITGALVCRHDLYLQLLEGPPDNIRRLYEDIRRDDRHIEITPLLDRTTEMRLFPDWAMRHDPEVVGVWSPDEVYEGVHETATEAQVLAIFERMAAT